MKRMVFWILSILLLLYLLLCGLLYLVQEKFIFFPEKLPKDFTFRLAQPFEEISIETRDHLQLHALLFKTAQPKGVVFYLHGNAGSLNSWGEVAGIYTDLG